MLVRDFMSDAACAVHATDSVMECARLMRDRKSGFMVVLDDSEQVVGVVTDRDLAVRLVAADLPVTTSVSVIMSTERLLKVRPSDSARALQHLMADRRQFRAVVVDDLQRLVGVVNWVDLVGAELSSPRASAPRPPAWTH